MQIFLLKFFLLFSSAAILTGNLVTSTSYDYSASIEARCLAEPPRPQYGGGIVRNPEFNDGLKGWSVFGYGKLAERTSDTGNRFLATDGRSLSHQSMSQKVYLQRGMLYTFSAWLQVDQGNTTVTAIFKTAKDGFVHVGAVEARSGCWSMLKGGLTAKSSGPAEFYFECENTSVEIWVDSVSLQPFTEDKWRAHQAESISKVRKKTVAIQAVDANGRALPGASVSVQQKRPGFPFGCAIANTILENSAYQSWFTSRFTVTTFENEMKWYANEREQGKETYTDADAMVAFAKQHGIAVRGHNVVWNDPQDVQNWVKSLPTQQIGEAVNRRFNSVMPRYRGKVIAWDVVNENVHFSYFESQLGQNASSVFYQQAHQLDPNALMFLNDYNTLEAPVDGNVTPDKFLQKLWQIQSFGNLSRMAIGLEGHFGTPDISYMRSALDKLAGANVPIWLTEVDVGHANQSKDLEDILREAYSHPAVQGIVMWGAWHPQGCWRMCLTDNNFKNLPTGDVVDKLIFEWKSDNLAATTDAEGLHRAELFHGEYKITINHPSSNSSSMRSLTCLAEPPRPQYRGGIVRNPEFNDGLKGWSVFGYGKLAERTSDTGNRFLATDRRSLSHQSMSQKVYLQRGMLYTFSAWLQVDQGNTTVTAIFKTAKDGFVHVGAVEARSGCWSLLKGGLTAKSSDPAEFYFESKNTRVEIWVDSVSLQPFTEDQWRAHQEESINKVRKKTVAIQAVDANGHALPGASVSIQQTRSGFPLGCALKSTILQSSAYQSWFTARFNVTTFTNEMKWYSNERVEGNETYAVADAMLAFAKQHGIAVRGHNVVWDDRQYVQNWVQSLPTQKLREAVNRRFNSVMTRYRGQVIAWDVVNENVHFSYFESRLGENASSIFYQQAHQLDPNALMFLNDFNTLEAPEDEKVTPEKYLQKLRQIQSFGNFPRMAIGLEGHFTTPDISYMRSALDKLAGANVPIWLTEVDVAHSNESKHLEDILREAYSHPAVQGIVIFGVWNPKGCFSRMCLTDVNFKNLPTGDVVDKLISEWRTHNVSATTDADGLLRAELFHGEYKVTINHPSSNSSSVRSLTVDSASQNNNVLTVMCLAEPQRAQYGGGIVRNPEFNDGSKGWSVFGFGQIVERTSDTGNRFLATDRRNLSHQSMSQKVYLERGMLYTFSAWLQVDQRNTTITAIFETAKDGLVPIGAVEARSGCWSMLKGGLTAKSSGPAEFHFESKDTSVEIWVDSVSLQPFTEGQWRAHQAESINKVRKKTVAIRAVDANGNAVPGASVSIQQKRSGFPFGCAIASTILENSAYQSWFTSRFTVTTFENEMKWPSNEPEQGKEQYADADAMLAFAKQHGIAVRGHNLVMDVPEAVQKWVQSLPTQQLREAVNKRFNSVIPRYRGQVIAWDVVNENIHNTYYEDKLGENASSIFYQQAHQLDPNALMFLNDFNTLEAPVDEKATPEKYLQRLQQIRSFGNLPRMAIGLESHFTIPDISYVRSALDKLAGANVPIWLTELDVANSNESKYLEDILREAYSHPAVQGIVMWGAWHPQGCWRMCLTDNNFKNLPTGDVVDKLIFEWKSDNLAATTDADGLYRAELFHGEYKITVSHPSSNSSSVRSFTLDSATQNNNVLTFICLVESPRPQYGGGIVRNPEFNDGLKGWSVFGYGQIAERTSDTGNMFLATERRRLSHQSVSQKVYLQRGMLYTFSAWLQVDQGNTTVTAIFKTAKDGFVHVGAVEARSGCWSMLKGGLTAKSFGPAEFYFESNNTSVEIWVDSVSLQPFTEDQWRAHQEESINKVRKKTVAIQAVDANGHALPGALVSIQQTRSGFPLGCALKSTILQSSAYQSWFTARFTVTTFTNEMKWYSNEKVEGNETYAVADAMLAFAKQHGIAVRGHNVVWDDRQYVQNWVQSLPTQKLREAVNRRFNNVMTRYRGQVIAWDVVNENVHFSYFESRLGENASSIFYQQAHQLDPHALMFLNEFNTLEVAVDGKSTPAKYLQKLQQIQSSGNLSRMAIGLEGHFGTPDISYMRSALDKLAGANVPIWLTEVDVAHSNEAKQLFCH
ncbi:unnamed protein product [Musa hybrid cultivar]